MTSSSDKNNFTIHISLNSEKVVISRFNNCNPEFYLNKNQLNNPHEDAEDRGPDVADGIKIKSKHLPVVVIHFLPLIICHRYLVVNTFTLVNFYKANEWIVSSQFFFQRLSVDKWTEQW